MKKITLLPTDVVSCAHCTGADATCCQCNGTRRTTFEAATKSALWAWEFPGCDCHACIRLQQKREHIYRISRPAPTPPTTIKEQRAAAAVPPLSGPLLRHEGHAGEFGKSFRWCQHTDCIRARTADRKVAS